MDATLLLVQVLLVLMLVVIPLFSGYDKWQSWSLTRKIVALAVCVGISVVVLGQYKSVVMLHKSNLSEAMTSPRASLLPFYQRRIWMLPLEYVGTVMAGSVLLAYALVAGHKGQYLRAGGFGVVFVVMMGLGVAVKLHWLR